MGVGWPELHFLLTSCRKRSFLGSGWSVIDFHELFWGFVCLGAAAFAAAVAAVDAAAVPAFAVVAEICDSFSGRVGIVLRYSSHSVITFIAVSIQHAVIILHPPLSHLIFNCCFKWQADCNHYVTSVAH